MKHTSQNKPKNKLKKNKDDILNKIQDNFDKKFKEISKILDIKKNYNIKFEKDNIVFSLGDNKVFSASFNFYGIIKQDGRFMWAYMIPGVDKRIISNIKKIKTFSHLFENSDNKLMMLYHQVLTQDSIILDPEEIYQVNKLILYLSEDLYFFNSPNNSGNIQIINISKINEKFI